MGESVTAESITTRDCNGISRQLPPNGGNSKLELQTPCQPAGSFCNNSGMQSYPTDPETGMPYPLRVFGIARELDGHYKTNDHHPAYQRRNPDVEGDLPWKFSEEYLGKFVHLTNEQVAGIALRLSRVYRASAPVHALAHKQYPGGPEIPHTVPDKFIAVMKNLAHVMPRSLYDPTASDGARISPMTASEYLQQATTSWVHPERYAFARPEGYQAHVLSLFFARYVGVQNITHVAHRVVDEFVSTASPLQKQRAGHALLREAAAVSVEPLQGQFRQYRRNGNILSDRREHPDLLVDVVMHYLAPAEDIAFKVLAHKLAA